MLLGVQICLIRVIVSVTKNVVWDDAYALVSLVGYHLYKYRDGDE